jgi:hypothetical protein
MIASKGDRRELETGLHRLQTRLDEELSLVND